MCKVPLNVGELSSISSFVSFVIELQKLFYLNGSKSQTKPRSSLKFWHYCCERLFSSPQNRHSEMSAIPVLYLRVGSARDCESQNGISNGLMVSILDDQLGMRKLTYDNFKRMFGTNGTWIHANLPEFKQHTKQSLSSGESAWRKLKFVCQPIKSWQQFFGIYAVLFTLFTLKREEHQWRILCQLIWPHLATKNVLFHRNNT